VRQQDEPGSAAVGLDSLEQALRLDRECPGVTVLLAMDQQDRRRDLVRVAERRNLMYICGASQKLRRSAWKPNGVSVRL